MYSPQIRAARGLLGWSQQRLAEESGVSARTVIRLEEGEGVAGGTHENVMRIQRALEKAGVVFSNDQGRIGVSRPIKAAN